MIKESKMKIANIEIKGIASLAPMAGITDRSFREICKMFGASYLTSEMVSVKGIIYNSQKTFDLASHSKLEKPFALQLFGSTPCDFYQAVKIIVPRILPDIIDINMGCPAPKIVKENSGSALMKTPELCGEIIRSVKQACDLPVTVKIRSGWNKINAPEVAKICQQAGADAITVHGRTKEQSYRGSCDLEVIKEVKKSVSIPVIGNGDITSPEDAISMLQKTNCDMVAIGRGAVDNPWIFSQVNSRYAEKPYDENISVEEKLKVIRMHLDKICSYKGEYVGVKEFKRHMSAYFKYFPGATEIRSKIFSSETKQQFLEICKSVENQL